MPLQQEKLAAAWPTRSAAVLGEISNLLDVDWLPTQFSELVETSKPFLDRALARGSVGIQAAL